jgi:hypothetical protein
MGSAREGPENDFPTIFPSNTELAPAGKLPIKR